MANQKTIDSSSIADKVKAARGKRTQLTLSELMAEHTYRSASVGLLRRVEQGEVEPSAHFLITLARATGKTITITPDTPYCRSGDDS